MKIEDLGKKVRQKASLFLYILARFFPFRYYFRKKI